MTKAPTKSAPPKKAPRPDAVPIECVRLRDEEVWKTPERFYQDDAGADLTVSRHITVNPGTRVQIPTNMAVAIPTGYFGLVLSRAATFHKRGLIVPPTIIDSEYRGEVMVLAYNPGQKGVFIQEGERLAQLLVLPVVRTEFKPEKRLTKGERDDKGFGSTGGFSGDPNI